MTLDLRQFDTDSAVGFSNNSTSPDGHEFVANAALPSGRYVIIVRGAASWERNPDYTLRLSVHSQPNAPVLGALSASPNPLTLGDNFTLSAAPVSGFDYVQEQGVA